MRNYFMHNTSTASADNAASIEIAQTGRIKQIQITCQADLDLDGEGYYVEFSLVPYFQGTTNDAQGPIAIVGERSSAATALSGINVSFPVDVPILNGSRIYINTQLTGTQTVQVSAVIHVA